MFYCRVGISGSKFVKLNEIYYEQLRLLQLFIDEISYLWEDGLGGGHDEEQTLSALVNGSLIAA